MKQTDSGGILVVVFAFLVAIGCVLLLVLHDANKSFPPIRPGAFVGQIELPLKGGAKNVSWYVERIPETEKVFVAVLEEKIQPSIIDLKPREGVRSADGKSVSNAPIELSAFGETFHLRGVPNGEGYKGTIEDAKGENGSWMLTPSQTKLVSSSKNQALVPWLDHKARYLEALSHMSAIRKQQDKATSDKEQLVRFLKDEFALQERAGERQKQLSTELERRQSEIKQSTEQMASLVSELDLMRRITKRGRVVDLARRVASRESKWYLANWYEGDQQFALERVMAEQEGVDYKDLNLNMKRAEEVRELRRQIVSEKEYINTLLDQERLKKSGGSAKDAESKETPSDTEKKSIWKRLFF